MDQNHSLLDAFLADIAARPEDLTPRLVLADWLEEQGHPELVACGQFVRAQIRLEDLPLDHADHAGLESQVLLHERRPAQRMACGVRRLARHWWFHRGAPEAVGGKATNVARMGEHLVQVTPLRQLHLSGVAEAAATLETQSWLRQIRSLSLTSAFPESAPGHPEHCRFLLSPHLTGLRELSLLDQFCFDPGRLAGAVWRGQIESLRLRTPHYWLNGWQDLLSPGSLRRLELATGYSTEVPNPPVHYRNHISRFIRPHLGSLEVLTLNCGTLDEIVRLLAHGAPRLRSLSLRGTLSRDIEPLLGLPLLGQLRVLELDESHLTDAMVERLAACPALAGLHELRLRWPAFHWIRTFKKLAISHHLQQLRRLALDSRDLSLPVPSRGIASLVKAFALPNLQTLKLHYWMDESGLERLLGADWIEQLHHLGLGYCHTEALVRRGPWPRLARLELMQRNHLRGELRTVFGERWRY